MSANDVLLEVEDGIATITLNQPDRMNALSEGIRTGIEARLDEVSDRDDARVVVLEGSGGAFCAGGDVKGMGEKSEGGVPDHERTQSIVDLAEAVPVKLYNYELPTIAKVDGYCVGAGVGVAMACDLVLASEDATFGLAFRNIGLTLDLATSLFVTRAVGPYVAKELALTGEMIDGEHAASLGLINHAYDADEFEAQAGDLIEQVATGPTVALHESVTNIDRSYNSTIREVVEREAKSQNLASSTRDHQEGIEAFGADRDPSFEGR
ncbi:enoyl-CoA hydratase [Salinadaptatus halalkaliphilus]|uniref:Enoyl-CoA hydratase n=1 Tax=Salinadaptatus halalkaliphilus TaxID=2419781 RepID=A0A4S3TSH3_9EURY|nr:enoyl-CoA hydratase-related protein [Salinadaptatus halalkaliphilus]THE66333.1 enoyl-CoA hydratase [Salinadaptatus halalkaliphilus]